MAEWQTPKTDWGTNPRPPVREDFDRIEGNIEYLHQLTLQPMRNVIINGRFDIWQRGSSFTFGSSAVYTADRWRANRVDVKRVVFRDNNAVDVNPTYYAEITVASTVGNPFFQQPVERVRTFAGKTATLSFYARANVQRTYKVQFLQYFGSGGSSDVVIEKDVTIGTSWQRYEVTVDLPSIQGKTIDAGNDSLRVTIYQDAAQANIGDRLDITCVQFEEGEISTPFENRLVGQEMSLCQRYFAKSYDLDVAPGQTFGPSSIFWYSFGGSSSSFHSVRFPVTMRRTPTVTSYSPSTGASNVIRNDNSSSDVSADIIEVGESGFTIHPSGSQSLHDRLRMHYTADAEL